MAFAAYLYGGRAISMGSKTTDPTTKLVEHDVLSYLLEHPKADDTVEGIVEWWLLKQEVQRRMAMVKEVLKELVHKGFVVETPRKDGRLHYRLNPGKRKEVQQLIASSSKTEK